MNSGDPERILIAEDDPDFRSALEFWLSDYADSDIVAVDNGQDAIDAIDSTVELFLCDQRMPNLTGPEVLDRLAQNGYDVPTIVISAYEPNVHSHEAFVDRHLSKPISRDELLEAIDQLLSE